MFDRIFTRRQQNSERRTVEHEIYLVESQRIEKKDSINYIIHRVDEMLGTRDFYYGYVHDSGLLTYYAATSKSYDVGMFPLVAPALAEKGHFVLRRGGKIALFSRDAGGEIVCVIGSNDQEGIDLDLHTSPAPWPESLRLKWSLGKPHMNAIVISGAIFAVAMAFYLYSSSAYEELSTTARQVDSKSSSKATTATGLLDFTRLVETVSSKIGDKAVIREVKIEKGKLLMKLEFGDRDNARDFIRDNGGEYADGKVITGWMLEGSKEGPGGK